MAATISATRAFFLGPWSLEGHGGGKAFRDPAPCLQVAAHGRVTDVARCLREIMADEVHCPALLTGAEVAGTLDEQVLQLCGDLLAFGGGPPGLRGVLQPWESSRLGGFEPGANGMLIAVEPLRDAGDTPALGIQ